MILERMSRSGICMKRVRTRTRHRHAGTLRFGPLRKVRCPNRQRTFCKQYNIFSLLEITAWISFIWSTAFFFTPAVSTAGRRSERRRRRRQHQHRRLATQLLLLRRPRGGGQNTKTAHQTNALNLRATAASAWDPRRVRRCIRGRRKLALLVRNFKRRQRWRWSAAC